MRPAHSAREIEVAPCRVLRPPYRFNEARAFSAGNPGVHLADARGHAASMRPAHSAREILEQGAYDLCPVWLQ